MTARTSILLLTATLVSASGCARTLVFSTGTTIGVKVSTVEEGQWKLKLGFERSEGTLMPLRDANEQDDAGGAYSLFASLCFSNRWPIIQGDIGEYFGFLNRDETQTWTAPSGIYIRQHFAAGKAAEKIVGYSENKLSPRERANVEKLLKKILVCPGTKNVEREENG